MIIFHEGLPRSGKSYEAVVRRIIPALKAGRAVDAYIEGLDHQKLADHAGISLERCQELLQVLTREQVEGVPEVARDNALVVLDEAQNFWGTGGKLGPAITQFVTEHGHRGIDIVLMGQSIKDVHPLWRRRVELKLCFLKLSGLGASGRYSVATWRHKGNDKYDRVSVVAGKYDTRYFGTYASHVSADTNTENYHDSRATIWGTKAFTVGLPLMLVASVVAVWVLWRFFHPPAPAAGPAPAALAASSPAARSQQSVVPGPAAPPSSAVDDRSRSPIERHLGGMKAYRLRLAGLARMGERVNGVVEWVSGDTRVMERMSLDTLRTLGVAVVVSGDTVQLAVGDWYGFATPWPIEGEIRVPQAKQDEIRGYGGQIVAAGPGGVSAQPRDLPGPIALTPARGDAGVR
ncbi:zona occludens toxin [Roseateles sp. YR242]|uniref:zonular occludens toxin family protein n=1 Tax=Roseateles sp. YR242 TaxID=1855305 RepID=UPI0008B2B3FC|nr:zonular occludens toxin domain-containing protein [Roseateles sp. YR242]SEL93644.1 zona occludens toxin [Roseateles sp. YR242]